MGLFTKKPTVAEVEALRSELAEVHSRIDAGDVARDRQAAAIAALPGDELRQRIAEVAERLDAGDREARAAAERLELVEQRLASVSVELARQLDELSSDIEALSSQPEHESAAVVEALRAGQVRLANEQARYEMALRADLAILAEQMRRLHPR
jgi:predicted RNase H-like nuclease (RuvC/YqgF family)